MVTLFFTLPDHVAMARRRVYAPPGRARVGVAPGRACRARAHQVAGPGRILAWRMQHEGRTAAAAFAVVQCREIAAVPAVARELGSAHAGPAHHPGDERARPRLAGSAAVPIRTSAGAPIVADLAGQRLVALGDAAAVHVAVAVAAVDDRRAAEPGPFLPGGVGDAVRRRPVGIAMPPGATAGRQQQRQKRDQKECWQPLTWGAGGAR